MDNIIDCIRERRSVRSYETRAVPKEKLLLMLEAGNAAPSGKNGQPWRYTVIQDHKALREQIAELTVYRRWVRTAPCLIVIWLDLSASYDAFKDAMALGACIQNILLAAAAQGLGCCWLGEILAKKVEIKALLDAGPTLEPVAVLTVGYPAAPASVTNRRQVRDNLFCSDQICD